MTGALATFAAALLVQTGPPPAAEPALATPGAGVPASRDWPSWRGPHHDGSSDARGLPTSFSRTEHVVWTAELPGPAAGTPVVFEDRVFVTSTDEEAQTLLALCFDRATGKERWRDVAGSGYQPGGAGTPLGMHPRSNYASPSPVTDGARVVFFYGNGDLVTYDLDGERIWSRNLQQDFGDFCFQWTFAASPTLWDDRLYLQILQRNEAVNGLGEVGSPSYLLCLDPDTGDVIFRHDRPSIARKESLESYATPLPYVGKDGRRELIVVGGDVVTGHDPKTGAELWRWGTWNEGHRQEWWRLVPTAVVGDGVVLVCAPKREPVYAISLGGEGTLGADALVWKSEGRANPVSSDVPTPLYYRGKFYVLSDVRHAMSRVDPKTGAVEWTVEMPRDHLWRASPTGADGKVWCIDHSGLVLALDAETGEVAARAEMGEEGADQIRASVVAAGDRLFLRTQRHLICLGE